MRLFTEAERVEVWERRQAGEKNRVSGLAMSRDGPGVQRD